MTTKLIAAVAAMTAGIAMADVTSQNVVGYQTLPGNEGFTFITPTFIGIGANYDIQNVKIAGDNVTGYCDQAFQILDADGNVQDEDYYNWFNEKEAYKTAPAGWFDANLDPVERDIEPGQSFLLENGEGEYTVSIPGVTF